MGADANIEAQKRVESGQLVVDNLTTAILLFDSSLRLREANTAAEAMLESSIRRLRGHRVDQVFLEADYWLSILTWAMETKSPFTERDVSLSRIGARAIRRNNPLKRMQLRLRA